MSFDEMMKKLKVKYLEDLTSKIEELKKLVEKKDLKEIESFMHKLKGSGASYGLPEISTYGAKYEPKAKNHTLSDEDLGSLAAELAGLYEASKKV